MGPSPANFDVIVAGAGPGGTSAAIHLALGGAKVLLVEQKKFPRAKLCGEFISPECFEHFGRLGVAEEMIASGARRLSRTVFYSCDGHSVVVPSEWFGGSYSAFGLSRSEMDQTLLQRALSLGVSVLEGVTVTDVLRIADRVHGVRVHSRSGGREYRGRVTIDATGRTGALVRRICAERRWPNTRGKHRFVAFKAHFENANPASDACEIYFYPGGYGGLSNIEKGISNLCFIASAKDVRRCHSDPAEVMREVVFRNARAAKTLARAQSVSGWLAISLDRYGRRTAAPAPGLLTVGDAAAFIDPFTGSGMLMAFESGEIAGQAILKYLEGGSLNDLNREYQRCYRRRFHSRLWISGLLRQAAFLPGLADLCIQAFSKSDFVRRKLARATRRSSQPNIGRVEGL